jgi:hypothetical protein
MRLDVPNALVPMTEQGWLLPMMTMKMGFAIWMRSVVVRIQMRATITTMLQTIAAIVSTPRDVTVVRAHPMGQVLLLTTMQTMTAFVMQMRLWVAKSRLRVTSMKTPLNQVIALTRILGTTARAFV